MKNTTFTYKIIGARSILGLDTIVETFKSIDWIIASKYGTNEDYEDYGNSIFKLSTETEIYFQEWTRSY